MPFTSPDIYHGFAKRSLTILRELHFVEHSSSILLALAYWIDVNETIIPAPSKTLDLQPLWMIVCLGPHDWIIEIGLFHFSPLLGVVLLTCMPSAREWKDA